MRAAAVLAAAAALAACAPDPEAAGFDPEVLDPAIGRAIGSPGTCVVIAEGERIAYRYGGALNCSRVLPDCGGGRLSTEAAAKTGVALRVSCPANDQGGVASWWTTEVRNDRGTYRLAASMADPDALPGVEMRARLKPALERAGLAVVE